MSDLDSLHPDRVIKVAVEAARPDVETRWVGPDAYRALWDRCQKAEARLVAAEELAEAVDCLPWRETEAHRRAAAALAAFNETGRPVNGGCAPAVTTGPEVETNGVEDESRE